MVAKMSEDVRGRFEGLAGSGCWAVVDVGSSSSSAIIDRLCHAWAANSALEAGCNEAIGWKGGTAVAVAIAGLVDDISGLVDAIAGLVDAAVGVVGAIAGLVEVIVSDAVAIAGPVDAIDGIDDGEDIGVADVAGHVPESSRDCWPRAA